MNLPRPPLVKRLLATLANSNPWLVFLPFLLVYALIALKLTPHDQLILDEGRYWGFAKNLLNGHYHYKEGYQFLWSGPGYPILLVPFVAMSSPLWVLKLLNALMLYTAVVLFFRLLRLYIAPSRALLGTLLFACYYPMFEVSLPYVMTEGLSVLLTVAATYLVCKAFRFKDYRWQSLLFPGLLFGYLALTKVIFGYVLLVMLLICLTIWLLRGRSKRMWHFTKVWMIAMALCIPYLVYTYSLTHKVFYWGNSGGLQLYWMSTPYEDELGDWHVPTLEEDSLLMAHHGEFFKEIAPLSPLEQDEALTRKAVAQIKAHPKKFVYNWVANVGRTFFSYPLSFLKPSNGIYKYLIPNIFLVVFAALMLLPTIRYYKKFPLEVLMMAVFSFVYLGGISLVASYQRFSYMLVPIWMLWIAWGLHRFVKVNFGNTAPAILPQPNDEGHEG